jgi:Protein of unknown function (DUF2934)
MNTIKVKAPAPQHVRAPIARRFRPSAPAESIVIHLPPAGRFTPRPVSTRREQAIRAAAYYHWAYRGCAPGGELADWLAAEQEVDELLAMRDALIREGAYARWLKKGRMPGRDVEDWLTAEREVDAALASRGILWRT